MHILLKLVNTIIIILENIFYYLNITIIIVIYQITLVIII